ncbi:hypothetical protein [Capnocytophaga sputigena]|uniref:hypothetical protein n=1 Tax=Capnocytophaga sputigena TaxID=1019 RepID=UPI0028D31680|nr:hypothetical protein [Capnocytophaga sputigena]
MNMIQERYLIWGSRELAIIIVTLVQITRLMAKFEVYDIKTIVTMIIIVFVLMVVFIYCNLQLLLMEILYFIKNKINSKKVININTLFYKTKDTIPANTIPANTLSLDSIPMNTASSDIINDNINDVSIRKAQNKKRKFDIAKEYITETFSPYCSNEEIENICAAIIDYSKGETDFSKYPSIEIKVLNNLDLYHFAWSIWNHFRVGKQDVIVKLLKVIFATKLSDVDVKTIKSHLKDDENKGIVKIKEDLSNPDEQKK